MKPGGKDGKLYWKTRGEAIVGGEAITLTIAGFYVIKSIGVATSLPRKDSTIEGGENVVVGQTVYLKSGQALATGDAVYPVTLKSLGFVKDIPKSQQGSSADVTTQEDLETGSKSFISSPLSEGSGSITGFVDVDSEEQKTILSIFNEVTEIDATHITRRPATQKNIDFMLSRRETTVEGETAVWEDLPVVVESIQMDKPLEGGQPFNFNYKTDGSRKPGVIYYKV